MENHSSQIAMVSGRKIEYALVGKGPTVLVSHGTLGGYDQALAIAQLFDQETFRFLAVSRAGYVRSSTGTGHTPEEQACSYRELLDQKGIASVAVMGLSGGSLSAIHFAQNYPDRCWALILISSIAMAPPPLPPFFRLAVRTQDFTMRFDPFWSLVHTYGLKLLVRSNGVTPDQVARIFQDSRLLSVVRGIFLPIKSSTLRRAGFLLDDKQIKALPLDPNYEISVPTLVCHAANDPMAPPSSAARFASSIPGAEYLETPDGGHLFFVVHCETVIPKIEGFLSANAPD